MQGVRHQANLTMVPETGLHKAISGGSESDVEDIEDFGRHITQLLNSEANWVRTIITNITNNNKPYQHIYIIINYHYPSKAYRYKYS